MEKGDLITYRGVEYVVTSLKNGVHAVLASTVDEAGTSGSSRYLGSIAEVEAELAEQAEAAEGPDAPAAYAWLGCRASIWAHRGYRVEGERVLCVDLDDARRVVVESLGCSLEELVCEVGEGEYYYLSQREAERDDDGSSADAVVGTVE